MSDPAQPTDATPSLAELRRQQREAATAAAEQAKLARPAGIKARDADADWQAQLEQHPLWLALCAETPRAEPWEADADRLQCPHSAHPVHAQRKAQIASLLLDGMGYPNTLDMNHPPTITLVRQEGGE